MAPFEGLARTVDRPVGSFLLAAARWQAGERRDDLLASVDPHGT